MSEQSSDPDAGTGDKTIDVRRAWKRPGSKHSTGEDDGILPLDDFHLHRYCAVYPYIPDDDPEYLSSEEYDELLREQGSEDGKDRNSPRVKFLSGYSRLGLRHTPLVILFTTIVLFGSAEFLNNVEGISEFLPPLSTFEWLGIFGGIVLYILLLLMVLDVGILDREEVYKGAVVYGLFAFLSIGVLLSMYLVFKHGTFNAIPLMLNGEESVTGGDEIPSNIVFVSGYLLMLLLGGLLVYDGMLRTEYLIENLDDTGIVGSQERYQNWKDTVRNQLVHTIGDSWNPFHDKLPIKTVYVFAGLFLTQYAIYWTIGQGPQNLDFALTTIANLLLNLFLVVVAFQFVILIGAFYRLLNEDRDERFSFGNDSGKLEESTLDDRVLNYKPYHSDGHAGYRDLGKFVTRVNLLLIISGFYLVYRLFFQGSRVTPSELTPYEFLHEIIGVGIWFQSFLAPVLLYGLVACAWIYYSFWQIHLRMLRERERFYLKETHDFESVDGWELREGAPVWPVNNGLLWSLISGTFGPVIIYIIEFM